MKKIKFAIMWGIIFTTIILSFRFNELEINYAMDNIHEVDKSSWEWYQQDILVGEYWFQDGDEIKVCRVVTHECK